MFMIHLRIDTSDAPPHQYNHDISCSTKVTMTNNVSNKSLKFSLSHEIMHMAEM